MLLLLLFLLILVLCLLSSTRWNMIQLLDTSNKRRGGSFSFCSKARCVTSTASASVQDVFDVVYTSFSWSSCGSILGSFFIICVCRESGVFHFHKASELLYLQCLSIHLMHDMILILFLMSSWRSLSILVTSTGFLKHFVSRVVSFLWWEEIMDQVWHWQQSVGRK